MAHAADTLHFLEPNELAGLIRDRAVSPVAVAQAQLDRIAALEPRLASYALVTAPTALKQAEAAETEIAAGRYRGPLHGVPISVKDLLWTAGEPTAGGGIIRRGVRPDADATVVSRLKAAGAIILGKTQMTEGAYADHHPEIAAPRNPWNPDYWSGISSSGSGAAVAAGLCFGTFGSDTGGSIRWPSAANGVTGLKPSWGRVSRHGALELAASLDHIGPMARSAADAAILLQAVAGSDPDDPTALPDPVPDYAEAARQGVAGLTIGIDPAWNGEDVDPGTQAALDEAMAAFRDLGARIVALRFPDVAQAIADFVPICAVEAAVAHEATFPSRKDAYGPVLAGNLQTGNALSGMDYQKALLRRADFRGRVDAALFGIDLLLTPVQPMAPLTLAEVGTLGENPALITALQRYTTAFDMTGHPTLTLPGGFDKAGMPIGIQLVAGRLAEATLIRAGAAFQGVTAWHRRHPPV